LFSVITGDFVLKNILYKLVSLNLVISKGSIKNKEYSLIE